METYQLIESQSLQKEHVKREIKSSASLDAKLEKPKSKRGRKPKSKKEDVNEKGQ